jgi:hypothetical protein
LCSIDLQHRSAFDHANPAIAASSARDFQLLAASGLEPGDQPLRMALDL